jgi:hypothetical protein
VSGAMVEKPEERVKDVQEERRTYGIDREGPA